MSGFPLTTRPVLCIIWRKIWEYNATTIPET